MLPKETPLHVRIDEEVADKVKESAEKNSRTAAREVNHVLKGHYEDAAKTEGKAER